MVTDPLLSNPAGFAILGVMIGLAAYLRQLGESRSTQIDDIEGGKAWNYPLTEMHTKEKLKHFRSSRERLNWVAPCVIWITIGVGVRLVFLAYARYEFPDDSQHYANWFPFADLITTLVMVALLVPVVRNASVFAASDDRVRTMMEIWKANPEKPAGDSPKKEQS